MYFLLIRIFSLWFIPHTVTVNFFFRYFVSFAVFAVVGMKKFFIYGWFESCCQYAKVYLPPISYPPHIMAFVVFIFVVVFVVVCRCSCLSRHTYIHIKTQHSHRIRPSLAISPQAQTLAHTPQHVLSSAVLLLLLLFLLLLLCTNNQCTFMYTVAYKIHSFSCYR